MEGTHCRRSLFPLEIWADATVLSTTQITIVRRDVMPDETREFLRNLEAKIFDAACLFYYALAAEDPFEQIQSVPLEFR